MTKFRLVLVLLCLGLLGALPFVISLPKPDTASAQQEGAAQGQTAVQRQMAAQRQTAAQREAEGGPVRAEIGAPLNQARNFAVAGEYNKALAVVDGLETVPNKTSHELLVIGQMRQYVVMKASGLTDPQTR